ncbi:MAG TPA: metal ABC transporter substrate-binding protein [Pilimelia sp.]|nr:metal ABC transporter substrate-binding protein [Pilimelia sp.]
MRSSRALSALAGVAALAVCGAGCATRAADDGDPDKVTAVAGFYPLHYLATRVGGPAVAVTDLAQPGAEPHDMELTPPQLDTVRAAELVVYVRGFQPAVDDAVGARGDRLFDLAAEVPLAPLAHDDHAAGQEAAGGGDHADAGLDPHLWLDPTRYALAGEKLAARLGAVDPPRAATYTANAAAFRAELDRLDGEFRTGLATCARRDVITNHAAFGYLTRRYRLRQVPISGLSPDEEPTPRRLAEVAALAKERKATTIFFETLVSPKVAETVAAQAGARTAVLDPVEGVGEGEDYLSVMRRNLAALRAALDCR